MVAVVGRRTRKIGVPVCNTGRPAGHNRPRNVTMAAANARGTVCATISPLPRG
jgi:hypothetical protein